MKIAFSIVFHQIYPLHRTQLIRCIDGLIETEEQQNDKISLM